MTTFLFLNICQDVHLLHINASKKQLRSKKVLAVKLLGKRCKPLRIKLHHRFANAFAPAVGQYRYFALQPVFVEAAFYLTLCHACSSRTGRSELSGPVRCSGFPWVTWIRCLDGLFSRSTWLIEKLWPSCPSSSTWWLTRLE